MQQIYTVAGFFTKASALLPVVFNIGKFLVLLVEISGIIAIHHLGGLLLSFEHSKTIFGKIFNNSAHAGSPRRGTTLHGRLMQCKTMTLSRLQCHIMLQLKMLIPYEGGGKYFIST